MSTSHLGYYLRRNFEPQPGVKLEPAEAFVWAHMQERMSFSELLALTGLSPDKLGAVLDKLQLIGCLQHVAAEGAVTNSVSPHTLKQSEPAPEDIDSERMQQIDAMFARIDKDSHYECLGVPFTATKEEIRSAYFRLSKEFHPDTLFGRNIGVYRKRMETIFRRLTEAYEILGRSKNRQEYDRYLEARRETQQLRDSILASYLDRQSIPPRHVTSSPPASAAASGANPPQQPTLRRPQQPDPNELRMRAARRLSRQIPKVLPKTSETHPAVSPTDVVRELASSLKQTAEVTGGINRAEQHLAHARAAQAKGDLIGALNAMRVAIDLGVDIPGLLVEYRALRQRALSELSESYRKQALYEESHQLWADAARTWAKVAEGHVKDPEPRMRAAQALLQSGEDMLKAQEYTQQALELDPSNPEVHVLLGRIYVQTGSHKNAKREFEAALKLDPSHQQAKQLLRSV